MSNLAVKRLTKEANDMARCEIPLISASPDENGNLFKWTFSITGPEDTLFESGIFQGEILFPPTYPLTPPTVKFTTRIYHPNVYPSGELCISILHPPVHDEFGYESIEERWSPAQSVSSILLSTLSLLSDINVESPANVDAARCYRENFDEFKERVRECVAESLDEDNWA
ncbi:hypothetical protein PCE1_000302 [Barthelona sp. PCE]